MIGMCCFFILYSEFQDETEELFQLKTEQARLPNPSTRRRGRTSRLRKDEETIFLRNFGNRLPSDMGSYPRKKKRSHRNKIYYALLSFFKSVEVQSCSGFLQYDVYTKFHENPPVVTKLLGGRRITYTNKPFFLITFKLSEGSVNVCRTFGYVYWNAQ
jgi:hypothetical protein